ncbi:cupin domain-containing protein [Novosphingobium sp. BL-52-GroH]|uniref:cupin domain-containing protein n=1 Tax=Novosphingobium sp. BL-52-GroH TaxID=3349877 RepID=UPI003850CFA7
MASRSDANTPLPGNLLQVERARGDAELFEDLLLRPGVRIERIVSHGHTTPPDRPYVQDWDEWVLVLEGSAELDLDGAGLRRLEAGDHILIPAGLSHRVTYTAEPTIWLAIHIGEPSGEA